MTFSIARDFAGDRSSPLSLMRPTSADRRLPALLESLDSLRDASDRLLEQLHRRGYGNAEMRREAIDGTLNHRNAGVAQEVECQIIVAADQRTVRLPPADERRTVRIKVEGALWALARQPRNRAHQFQRAVA